MDDEELDEAAAVSIRNDALRILGQRAVNKKVDAGAKLNFRRVGYHGKFEINDGTRFVADDRIAGFVTLETGLRVGVAIWMGKIYDRALLIKPDMVSETLGAEWWNFSYRRVRDDPLSLYSAYDFSLFFGLNDGSLGGPPGRDVLKPRQ